MKKYSPKLAYLQGSKNSTADILSRLDMLDIHNPVRNNIKSINDYYGLEDEEILCPTIYKMRNIFFYQKRAIIYRSKNN